MNEQLVHPDRDALAQFGLGKLAAEDADFVERHLADCPSCCETLLELQDDTFIERLRGMPPAGGAEAEERADASLPAELADHPRYRMVKLLGRGGMGDVYQAEHRLMNRPVALKVMNRGLMKDARAVERFRREVQAAARLAHPNIVAAYDAEQAGDLHFLAMEYVPGTDLAQWVRQHGPMPVPMSCECIRQAAEALQHAHERGMVHRDIKPQNLMLLQMRNAECGMRNEENENDSAFRNPQSAFLDDSAFRNPHSAFVKVLDFGLARFAAEAVEPAEEGPARQAGPTSRLTSWGATMGTPDYIAPEQSRSARDADIRSDIYSLGCTFYFLLSGRSPFPKGSPQEKLHAHANETPPPLSELRDDVPPELEAIVARMMAKDPAERYQQPAEVAKVVGALRAPSPKPTFNRKAPSPPWATLACLLLIALGFLSAFGAVFFVRLGETTVRFEVEDPSLAVRFGEDEITIDHDGRPIRVTPGEEQTFTVAQDGLEAQTTSFTLRKGDNVVLRVSVDEEGRLAVRPKNGEMPLDSRPLRGHEPKRSTSTETIATESVRRFAITADRKTIVALDGDGRVGIWDASSRRLSGAWETGSRTISHVAVSARSKAVALADYKDKKIWIRNLDSGNVVRSLPIDDEDDPISALAFSPDGEFLALGASQGRQYDAGQRSTAGTGPAIRLWRLPQGAPLDRLELPPALTVRPGEEKFVSVRDVTFSPDGRFFAAVGMAANYPAEGTEKDRERQAQFSHWIYVWDPHTGALLDRPRPAPSAATAAAFTPDSQYLVAAHGETQTQPGKLSVWRAANLQFVRTIAGGGGEKAIQRLDISPDGRMALTVSAADPFDGGGSICIWRLGDRQNATLSPPRRQATAADPFGSSPAAAKATWRLAGAAFLADSRSFIVGGSDGLTLRRLPQGNIEDRQATEGAAIQSTVPDDDPPAFPKEPRSLPIIIEPQEMFRGEHAGKVHRILALAVADVSGDVATAHEGGVTAMWDAEQQRETASWKPATWRLDILAISPDGRLLAGGAYGSPIHIWETERRGPVRTITEHDGRIGSLAFSPDGRMLALGGRQGTTRKGIPGGYDQAVRLWDPLTGAEIRELEMPELLAVSRDKWRMTAVSHLAFSTDGKVLVACGNVQEKIDSGGQTFTPWLVVWDVASGRVARHLTNIRDALMHVALTPDGRLLITANGADGHGPYVVRIWELATGRLVRTFAGHQARVTDLDVSSDGRLVLSNDNRSIVRVWDIRSGKEIARRAEIPSETEFLPERKTTRVGVPYAYEIHSAFLPDGRSFVTGGRDGVRVWRFPEEVIEALGDAGAEGDAEKTPAQAATVATIEPTETLAGEHVDGVDPPGVGITGFAISPDRRRAFVGHNAGVVAVADLREKREIGAWKSSLRAPTSLAVSGDGRFVAVGAQAGGGFELWDSQEQVKLKTLEGTAARLRSLALSPDGRLLAFGATQNLDTVGGQQVIRHDLAFGLRTWQGEAEAEAWIIPAPIAEPGKYDRVDVDAVAFSHSGRLLIAAGDIMHHRPEGGIEEIEDFALVWNAEWQAPRKNPQTGKPNHRFERVKTHAVCVAFTPDDRRLVTGHAGGNVESCVVRVWDVETGRVLREMQGHAAPVISVNVSPDGELAASSDATGEIRVWRLADGAEIARHAAEDKSHRPRSHVAFLDDSRTLVTAGSEGVRLWSLPEGAGSTSESKQDPERHAALEELVKIAEESLSRVRTQYEAAVVSRGSLLEAEIELLEAKIRRAKARGNHAEVVSQLERLVTLREQFVADVREGVEQGVLSEAVYRDAQKELIEAKLRLGEAKALGASEE